MIHTCVPRTTSRTLTSAALSLALSLSSAPLVAQDSTKAPATLRGIEVVATRVPKATHDVPASIEVITGKTLRDRGVVTLRDALSQAAGISIAPGGDAGPAGAVPEIWGLREFDAFLLVVDNVPWGGALNPAVTALSLRDVERIEILRGPAPVTYGATSFVGVIHVVHSAAAQSATYLSAMGGTNSSGSIAADFVLPSSGTWKSRATVDVERQGFTDDRTAYQRAHTLLRTARTVNAQTMYLTADVNVLRQDPASPHPREGAALSTKTPLDANYNPDDAYLNDTRIALIGGYERPVLAGVTWGTTASFTHSAQRIFRGFLTNISNTANNASGFKENIDINDVYADTHLLWPSHANIRLMTGADVLFAAGEAKGATFSYTVPLAATSATSVAEPAVLDRDAEDERRFAGLYGSAEWQPVPRLSVTGGVRLNLTSEKRGEGTEVTHTKPSGSLGVLYGLWERGEDHLRAFANFRSTFKPAAFDFGLAENEGVLEPETSRSYEGGLKVRSMQGRVDVEATYFSMDFENLVTSSVVNNLPSLTNAGTTRFRGYEIATDVMLPHDLSVRASYSGHDGKFVDYVQSFDGVNTQLGGRRFEMSAKALASAGLVYAPETGLLVHAGVSYTGDRYLNKRNTALAEPFTTIDAGAGYRVGRFELRVDGRNLGDRRDPVAESEFGDAQYYRMTPRSVQAGVTVRY